ncbi:MAG: hypothetical protein AAB897_03645 [Patescibacteria group bacterium]
MNEAEGEKKIDLVLGIILMLLALLSDGTDALAAAAFAIPVLGQITYLLNAFLISPVVWAIIQFSFIMKMGFAGRVGLMNLTGGILNVIGIPGSETLATSIAIWFANHPKAAAVAQVATGKVGAAGGKAAAAEKAGAVAGGGAVAEKTAAGAAGAARAERGAEAAVEAERGVAGAERAAVSEGRAAEGAPREPGKGVSEEAMGVKPEEAENLPRKLLEEFPEAKREEEAESEGEGEEELPKAV